MNTAEQLVKESDQVLETKLRIPIVLQKCAERGYTPETEEELRAILNIVEEVTEKMASGELAPVPRSYLTGEGEMTKAAEVIYEQDPLAFAGQVNIVLDEMEDHIKEAAAVKTWEALEQMAKEATAKEAEQA